jgi:hypothetical protein
MAALLLGSLLLGAHPALAQSTDPPIVTILAPASPVYTSRPSVDVSGVVDSRVAVVEVTWTSDRGGQGAASGTTSWSAEGVPLEPGWNELVVTARDLLGNIATAAVSVVYEASPSTSRIAAPLTGATPTSTITWSTVTSPAAGAAPSPPRTAAVASAAGITLPAGGDPGDVQLITGGPVAAYGFDEGSGPTVADLSGNDNTGTLHGTVDWTSEGKFGSALAFHGSGFVTVPSSASLDLTSGMTLEAWVYPTAMSTRGGTVIMKEQPGQLVYALRAGSSTGRPRTEINLSAEAAGERALNGPAIVPLHAWTHLASTYDGSTLRLYVNGVFVASRGVTGPIATSTGALRIGGNTIWGEYFRGRIDDVRLYDRALSQVEIRNDMATPVGSQSPAATGQWAGPFAAPLVPIHATLLRTGPVAVWEAVGGGDSVHLWDPASNTFAPTGSTATNIFCAGHCALPDGRMFVVGGHIDAHLGLPDANVYDPVTEEWEALPPMSRARWYPTATTLPSGRLLVTAGEDGCFGCYVDTPEIYDPQANTWTALSSATASLPFYPHMFVLPDGKVLAASATEDTIVSRVLDVATQTWSIVDPVAVAGGSAVMYRPGQIMKAGTNFDSDVPVVPSAATTYVLDMTKPAPRSWQETTPMAFPRAYHNLTLLPDGQVLVTGGGDTTDAVGVDGAIGPAELWSPLTKSWTTLAAMQTPRLYHSIALLLPDGRVLVGGGGRFNGPAAATDQTSIEIFSPPYLFKGARPVITTAPATTSYGATMMVPTPDAARIESVALVKPGSVTHSFNADQRYVPLSFTTSGTALTVHAPANANLAPPGYYMLFIVDTNGIPSVAKFVRIQ